MAQAIEETNRRRKKQDEYNKAHDITPKALNKKVIDIMRLEVEQTDATAIGIDTKTWHKCDMNNPKEIISYMNSLREEMKVLARDLKFEKAAQLRDQIKELDEKLKAME